VAGLIDDLAGSAEQSFSQATSTFANQNLSPMQVWQAAQALPQTVGGIPGIGPILNDIPGVGRIPIPGIASAESALTSLTAKYTFGRAGEWQSPLYAADLIAHQPKFKFLFKVGFLGDWGAGTNGPPFYAFVHHVDKPKVKINHVDVNYYNFRTRVKTSVTYDQLSMTFLDEIGDSVNQFFANYLSQNSGTGNGFADIDQGFGRSSSSIPYTDSQLSGSPNGTAGGSGPAGTQAPSNRYIVIEQIFANGTQSNRFVFINPRIEAFDFDDLSMEENNGSMITIMFSYGAIMPYTSPIGNSTIYSWGNTDLLAGGGTSGPPNGGSTAPKSGGALTSFDGSVVGGQPLAPNTNSLLAPIAAGIGLLNSIPTGLPGIGSIVSSAGSVLSGSTSVLSSSISNTLGTVQSGANVLFSGNAPGQTNPIAAQAAAPSLYTGPDGADTVTSG
jgi:hypothetical protein